VHISVLKRTKTWQQFKKILPYATGFQASPTSYFRTSPLFTTVPPCQDPTNYPATDSRSRYSQSPSQQSGFSELAQKRPVQCKTASGMHRWGMKHEPTCSQCGMQEPQSFGHLLHNNVVTRVDGTLEQLHLQQDNVAKLPEPTQKKAHTHIQ